MLFITSSGSRYQLDQANNRIRRLSGNADPTMRQGKDGDWRTYFSISPIVKGNSVSIVWGCDTSPLTETQALIDNGINVGLVIPTTITSAVVAIDEQFVLN